MHATSILWLGLSLCLATGSHAQQEFSGSYTETFDALGISGNALLPGWAGVNTLASPGTPLSLGVTAGTTTAGGLYNVGGAGDTDRALGSLATGTVVPRFGVQFRNTAAGAFTQLTLAGVLEQWRSGSSATANESLLFEYSLDAVNIDDSTAGWLALPAFNLAERLIGTTSAGALNGNLTDHQLPLGGSISGIQWLPNSLLTLRWTDLNDAGSDGLYALDNFSLTGVSTVPEPSVPAFLSLGLLAWLARRARR